MLSGARRFLKRDSFAGLGRLLIVLLPCILTYLVLWQMATAVPIIDDYPHIFAFALAFQKAPTLAEKLALILTTQVGPYKLIFDHALVGLQLLVFRRLNFPLLILLGNLTPLGIFAVLWRNAERRRWILLLPVSLLLFGLNYAETLDWAISGLQQPMVILFSLAAIHFLVKAEASDWDLVWACGLGVLASTTYANGMIVWPVGLLFLLVQRQGVKRLVGWSAAFVAMLVVYLYRYQPGAATAHAAITKKAVFFVMFCGGALENMHHRPVRYVSVVIGLVALGVFVHAVRTRYDRRNAFFFYSTVWVLMTGLVEANARTAMGMQLSMSSRYKIYCDLLLIFCYEYLLDRVFAKAAGAKVRRWVVAAFVAAAVVFLAGDYAGARLLKTRKLRAEGAMRRYLAAPETASPMFVVEDVLSPAEVTEEEKARQELSEAIRVGIYAPPRGMVAAAAQGTLAIARPEWFAQPIVGADGRRTYPAEALAGAYRATAPWGTILLSDARYVSPFYAPEKSDPCAGAMTPYASPRKFVGVGRPRVDDEVHPQELAGGTVVLGEICGGTPIQLAHLGVDVGPGVVREIYGGVKANGIFLPASAGFNQKRGTRIEDVSVLTNDQDGQHSVLLEGDEGAVVDGLWIWTPGGTHGLVLKGAHSTVRNFHCKGAKADCLLVKSDYRTDGSGYVAADRFDDIDISYLERPGDTGGISFDARWDNIDGVTFRGVHERGLGYGFAGTGSWFYTLRGVDVDGWVAAGMMGPCAIFQRSFDIQVADFSCEETAGSGDAAFILEGRRTTLRDGTIGCADPAAGCAGARMNGVVDGGKQTMLERLGGQNLGGYLVAATPSARKGSYVGLQVSGMDGRLQTRLKRGRKPVGARLKEFWGELKIHLRIVWQTGVTLLRRFWRWVGRRP
jgi:hypothetical protein